MLDLYKNGTIHFNTIDYFQRLEKEQGSRGDSYEGTTSIKNYHDLEKGRLTLTIPETGQKHVFGVKNFHLRQYLSDIKGNLYSLYCLKSPDVIEDVNYKIDSELKKFGTHIVVIRDINRFLKNIFHELKKQKISYEAKLVNYYEKKHVNGDITLFDKTLNFEYQKEYRIVLYINDSKPFSIKIGSLKEYAEFYKSDAIDDMKIDFGN